MAGEKDCELWNFDHYEHYLKNMNNAQLIDSDFSQTVTRVCKHRNNAFGRVDAISILTVIPKPYYQSFGDAAEILCKKVTRNCNG